jgi:hypothetical protein
MSDSDAPLPTMAASPIAPIASKIRRQVTRPSPRGAQP